MYLTWVECGKYRIMPCLRTLVLWQGFKTLYLVCSIVFYRYDIIYLFRMHDQVNQMLSQALEVLLQLDMGSYSIADRLHPLTACIHNHLVATSSWLYPQCFQVFCQELWRCIVKVRLYYRLKVYSQGTSLL